MVLKNSACCRLFLKSTALIFFMISLLFIQGCVGFGGGSQETEVELEEQEEFIAWARPIYRQIEKSDQIWLNMTQTMVFYTDEEDKVSREELERIAEESVAIHNDLIDYFGDTEGDQEEKKLLKERCEDLSRSRLKASELIIASLKEGKKPDTQSEQFSDVRRDSHALAAKFESIMKEYDLVWAHLKYED